MRGERQQEEAEDDEKGTGDQEHHPPKLWALAGRIKPQQCRGP
jgi:hypothetical protein